MMTTSWPTDFISSLEQASDLRRQEDAWNHLKDYCFPTPVELVCQLFDDSAIDELMDAGVVFSETTDAALKELSSLAGELNLDIKWGLLLSSPAWRQFVGRARAVLVMVRRDCELVVDGVGLCSGSGE